MKSIFKIIEISHYSKNNELLWTQHNISNILHNSGKEFILKTLFTGEESIPNDYYVGLDSRSTLSTGQTMSSLSEPSGNGYTRQTVSSTGDFNYNDDDILVLSGLLTFVCTSGSYSVKNVFLTNEPDNTGFLISSLVLSEARTLTAGETITIKAGFSLG
jgi:hypothetical protein